MHIAISGRLGSGKSTVCKILNEKYGFEIYSTGKIQRAIAEKRGISTLELNKLMTSDPKLDYELDNTVNAISRERSDESLVFDSRMAWHFAENAFKVYIYVDPSEAARRIMNDNRGNVEKYKDEDDAREQLECRTQEENKRYMSIYGVDNLDFRNYDLIIDSSNKTPDEIAEKIIAEFKKIAK